MRLFHKHALAPYTYMPLTYALVGLILFAAAFFYPLNSLVSAYGIFSGNAPQSARNESIFDPKNTVSLDTVSLSQIKMPKYGQKYAEMTIDSVGIKLDLYFGDSADILKKGAGQYIGSYIPGYGKPILIAGHNTIQHLKPLKDIKIGDTISIQTNYGSYCYQIFDTRIAKATDITAYDLSQNNEVLILYTCYPFGVVGYKPDRLFVYGKRISGPIITK